MKQTLNLAIRPTKLKHLILVLLGGILFLQQVDAAVTVTKLTNYGAPFIGYSQQPVMAVNISDSSNGTLKSFSIKNLGTMVNGMGVSGVAALNLWQDSGTNNKVWSSEDIFVCNLAWNPTALAWSNGNISFPTQLGAGKRFIVTADPSPFIQVSNTFKGLILANKISVSGGMTGPAAPLTNNFLRMVPQFFKGQELMGANQGLDTSAIALGDYDADGDLDFTVTGNDGTFFRSLLYRNDLGPLVLAQEPMGANAGLRFGSIAMGDIDSDGDLDMVVVGADASPKFRVYRNDSGTFVQAQEPLGVNQGVAFSSVALRDFDNDGDLDIAVTGEDGMNYRFIIYRNDNGFFTIAQQPAGVNQGYGRGCLAVADYDNDGDLDIAVSGENPTRRFHIYRNDSGILVNAMEPLGAGVGLSYSSFAWGDYDNDGDLDLAVTGNEGPVRRFVILRNDQADFTNVQEPLGANVGLYNSSVAWGDYDNDGDLDLVLSGFVGATRRFMTYRNDGGTFNLALEPMGANIGVDNGSIALGDLDNDGKLDIFQTGMDSAGNRRFTFWKNTEKQANVSPSIPTGMSATNVGGYWRLKWNKSTDDHTVQNVLRYQIAIRTNSFGSFFISSNIDYPTGQANIGRVSIVTGTPYYQTQLTNTKSLAWKVCAIDTGFKNSAYCAEQYTEPTTGPFWVDVNKGSDFNAGTPRFPFKTIQKAVDRIRPGINVTSTTAYVKSGRYVENVRIYSNKNQGLMVIRAFSNGRSVLASTLSTNTAFNINSTSNVAIQGFRITNFATGIRVMNNSCGNIISGNTIIRSSSNNIVLKGSFGLGRTNNLVLSNIIQGRGGSQNGIFVDLMDNVVLRGNLISRCGSLGLNSHGILVNSGSVSNLIVGNTLQSNTGSSIQYNTTGCNNQKCISNQFINNYSGISGFANSVLIKNNYFRKNSTGILIGGTVTGTRIIGNTIYSNYLYAGIDLTLSSDAIVASNIISGGRYGIRVGYNNINRSVNHRIFRNYVFGATNFGIHLSIATNIMVANNTLVNSRFDGIYMTNSSRCTLLNNIIFSNGKSAGKYGVRSAPGVSGYMDKNCIYGSYSGDIQNNGILIIGSSNTFGHPRLDMVTARTIASPSSYAVDIGTVIPGISDTFQGLAPDAGWKESPYMGSFVSVAKLTNFSTPFTGYSNQTVMALNIIQSTNGKLGSFRIRNIGTLTNGNTKNGITAVKLWQDSGTNNKRWSSQDQYVCNLYWKSKAVGWTNGNISYPTQLGGTGKRFIVTVDLSPLAVVSNTFQGVIPAYGVADAADRAGPHSPITNIQNRMIPQFVKISEPLLGDGNGLREGSLVYGDYDNDGDLDIAMCGIDKNLSPRLIILRNDSGLWTKSAEPMLGDGNGTYSGSLAFGDYDNDGDLDLAVSGYDSANSRRLLIYRNDGGAWTKSAEPMLGDGNGVRYSSLAFGDYNNDGNLDLAVSGQDNSFIARLIIYRNDKGTWTKTAEPMLGGGNGVIYGSIIFGDYDNDGDLDLAVGGEDNVTTKRLIIYRNDGGVWTMSAEPMQADGIGASYSSIAFGDYDYDGDLDLAVGGRDNTPNLRLIIYRNDNGTWVKTAEPMLGEGNGVQYSSVAFGDYDNDGDLDLGVSGQDNTSSRRLLIYRNNSGTWNKTAEPMLAMGNGVFVSSLIWGDYDNDGDLDFATSGEDNYASSRMIVFKNTEKQNNLPPAIPTGMTFTQIDKKWRLMWNKPADDHTPQKTLRYQIAIGTNSGQYIICSTNIDFPRGQANLGKVTVVTGTPYYQTKITNMQKVYWKVCAIDSAFKASSYCPEQVAQPPSPQLSLLTNLSGIFSGYSNQTVMSFHLQDSNSGVLQSLKIKNLGTLTNGDTASGILSMKLWQESGTNNKVWSSEDVFVCNLIWKPGASIWSNGNISYLTQLGGPGKKFVITLDLSSNISISNSFKGVIPVSGIGCSGGRSTPYTAITNNQHLRVPQFLKRYEPMGKNVGVGVSRSANADIDQDGDLDLIMTGLDGATYRFLVFRNDGGSFVQIQEPMGVGDGIAHGAVAPADFDNDGDLDLAVIGESVLHPTRFIIFRNDAGTFNLSQEPLGANLGMGNASVAIGDIDNDGDSDLAVIGNDGTSRRFILYKNTGGIFTLHQEPMGSSAGVDNGSVSMADIDQDGNLDVVFVGHDGVNTRFMVWKNDGTTFSLSQEPMGPGIGVSQADLAMVDFNNDGCLDAVLCGNDGVNNRFVLFRNNQGSFLQFQEPMGINQGLHSSEIASVDFDYDGDLDLFISGQDSTFVPHFKLFRNENGAFTEFVGAFGGATGMRASSIVLADYDQDGNIDMATGGSDSSHYRFLLWRNTGNGVNAAPTSPSGAGATGVGGYWRLSWNRATDDHSSDRLLRYVIAIGSNTNSVFDVSSGASAQDGSDTDYGNVLFTTNARPYYQTTLLSRKPISFKVRSVDQSFQLSPWSATFKSPPLPVPKTILTLSAVSTATDRIALNWSTGSNTTGYALYKGNLSSGLDRTLFTKSASLNAIDTGLIPNKRHYYWVAPTNHSGEGLYSSPATAITWPASPWITSDLPTESIQITNRFVFTNKAPVGIGGVSGYRYVWSPDSLAKVTNTSLSWNPSTGKSITNNAAEEGLWFLSLRGINSNNELGPRRTFGPYQYFQEQLGPFRAQASKQRINPDGNDTLLVRNSTVLTNFLNGSNIVKPKIVYVQVVSGLCEIQTSQTNGYHYVRTTNAQFSVPVTGLVVNPVVLRLWWDAKPDAYTEANFLVSPAMDIRPDRDAVIYENVIAPGSVLEIYVNSSPDEEVTVHVYDVASKLLVRKLKTKGGTLSRIGYDLKTENGNNLPEGLYGILIQGQNWKKEMKFVIKRR